MEQTAAIGKIINTHGVKGALKVQVLSDFPERVKELRRVFVEKDGKTSTYKVLEAFINGRFWVIRLEGINDIEAATPLFGSILAIPLSERVALPADAYYFDQIIDLAMYTVDGLYLGKITDVIQTGSNDVYVARNEQDGTEVLIPALKAIVKSIDLELGRVVVDPPEGLL